tara:strand:+ start:769 stop:1059 length:291 start_codon:yes stop_codon:yes gene_type:complete
MVKGYWVAKANILDDEKLSRYGKQAEAAIEKFGGKFLVRGGQHETKEGIDFMRNVVVEFDSYDIALNAYNSPEYKKALELLEGGAERMYAVVEGYE